MTVAVDTNVLVRYLTWDDLPQARAAARLLESGEIIWISNVVLCELVWVLRRAYGLSAEDVADTIQEVVASQDVSVDRPTAEAGLALLRQGGDFADGVVRCEAVRARCRGIATFDRAFAGRLGDFGLVLG